MPADGIVAARSAYGDVGAPRVHGQLMTGYAISNDREKEPQGRRLGQFKSRAE